MIAPKMEIDTMYISVYSVSVYTLYIRYGNTREGIVNAVLPTSMCCFTVVSSCDVANTVFADASNEIIVRRNAQP
jgi:hypothetical protein